MCLVVPCSMCFLSNRRFPRFEGLPLSGKVPDAAGVRNSGTRRKEAQMLPQKPAPRGRKLKLRQFVVWSVLPFLGVVTAFGVMPQTGTGSAGTQTVVEEITLPHTAPSANATTFWRNDRVQGGDTVADLLRRLNVEDSAADNYLRTARAAESFRKLAAGKAVQAETASDGSLLALRYPDNSGDHVLIEKNGNSFSARTLPAQLEHRIFMRTGEIKTT